MGAEDRDGDEDGERVLLEAAFECLTSMWVTQSFFWEEKDEVEREEEVGVGVVDDAGEEDDDAEGWCVRMES